MRVGVETGVFLSDCEWFLMNMNFKKGSVFNLINPDVNQEIYGVPEYLAATSICFFK